MIKINKVYADAFIQAYVEYALEDVLYPKIVNLLNKVPLDEQAKARGVFTKDYLRGLLIAPPALFETKIEELFALFPMLAERYCYAYLLRESDLVFDALNLDIQSPAGKDTFDLAVNKAIAELRILTTRYTLCLTPHILEQLESGLARHKKKRYLCRLENAKRGHSQVTDADKERFPTWIQVFKDCFDYEAVSERFGMAITGQLALTVCPYCALEEIQTYSAISVRPDIDHFFPKTRFPFLAISLFNLIPAGSICNQKHKRNSSMLGHMNPYIDSLEGASVFRVGFVPDGNEAQTLTFDVVPQNDPFKDKNIELFKIKGLYNGNENLRAWYLDTYKLREFLKGQGVELSTVNFNSPLHAAVLDLGRPITKVSAQKFKVEAINDLFEQALQVVSQPEN